LNAFDIISLSTGFDLSGFFYDRYSRREERFTTRQPVTAVFTKLKELAKCLKLKVKKKENGTLKLAALKEGKKGILELDADIFEVARSLLLVELKKTNGDTLEYQKLVKEEIRPALKDIVWVWQSDQHKQSQPTLQGQQPQSAFSPQDQLQPSLLEQEQQGLVEAPEPLYQSQLTIASGQPEQTSQKETLDCLQLPIASEPQKS
jgi:5'-AMP-activated protein kinase, catalytic alpha subunit